MYVRGVLGDCRGVALNRCGILRDEGGIRSDVLSVLNHRLRIVLDSAVFQGVVQPLHLGEFLTILSDKFLIVFGKLFYGGKVICVRCDCCAVLRDSGCVLAYEYRVVSNFPRVLCHRL